MYRCNRFSLLSVCDLQRWVTSRQMRYEGGFQGRCNKLVDGCYSFWQAGLLPLLHRALFKDGETLQGDLRPRAAPTVTTHNTLRLISAPEVLAPSVTML